MDFFVALSAVMAFCTALSAVLQKKGKIFETVVAALLMVTAIMTVTMVVTLVIGHDGYKAWSVASAVAKCAFHASGLRAPCSAGVRLL